MTGKFGLTSICIQMAEPDANVKTFLGYMLSDDIQQGVVKELGYLPITEMKVGKRSVEGSYEYKLRNYSYQ